MNNAERFANSLHEVSMSTNDVRTMFDRAEALQNAAKAIKGIKALDDDALETLYSEAKAERRAREKVALNKKVAGILAKRFGNELWNQPLDEIERIENEVRRELKTQGSEDE